MAARPERLHSVVWSAAVKTGANTMSIKLNSALAVACGLVFCQSMTAFAADELDDQNAERCIPLRNIVSTDIVDDSNILFYMRGNKVYLNQLSHRCPGLRNEKTFMYRTSMSELCDLDIITVLNNRGFGFTPGASCGLGRFHPISKDAAKAMKNAASKVNGKELEPPEPEEVGVPQ
jgi:hypothetical protein